MAASSSADDAARFSMVQVEEKLEEANQRHADEQWSAVMAAAQETIDQYKATYEKTSGVADALVEAVAVARYVAEQAELVWNQVDPDNPRLVGVPRASANGRWRDRGRFNNARTELDRALNLSLIHI